MSELHELLSADHDRLDALLAAMVRDDGTIDEETYAQFRRGLLTHIGIEEKILFPEARSRGGDLDLQERLHRDHAVLAALLVPPPTAREIEQIRTILRLHNPLEESPGGFYESVEQLTGADLDEVMRRIRAFPEARVAPHSDSALLRKSIEELLRKAGR